MTGWRSACVSLLLLVVGAVLVARTQDVRRAGMHHYALYAAYNEAISDFLVRHRAQLVGRPLAVLGVSGLSPWALTGGWYLNRVLGANHEWNVFVPRPDPFYPARRVPIWQVVSHPESEACSMPAGTLFIAFDPRGHGKLMEDCNAALAFAHPRPVVDLWEPKSVTPAQAAAGFVMVFRGENLTNALAVRVDGKALDMVRTARFDLMTTTVPGRSGAVDAMPFQLLHRDAVVLDGVVAVTPQARQ